MDRTTQIRNVPAFCPRCAEPVEGGVFVPADYRPYRCPECGLLSYAPPSLKGRARCCVRCERLFDDTWHRPELEPWELVPAKCLCGPCESERLKFLEEGRAGGVTWYCSECEASGLFTRDNPISQKLREQEKVYPPQTLGVTLSEGCPACKWGKYETETEDQNGSEDRTTE